MPSFVVEDDGVYYVDAKGNRLRICSKLVVTAQVRNDQSNGWGRLLEFNDADGKLHRWSMPMALLSGRHEELLGELLQQGLAIAPQKNARQRLVEYLATAEVKARAICVNRTGWYKNIFVLPDQTIGEFPEQVVIQAETYASAYKQKGTLEEWQRYISTFAVGNPRMAFALSVGFASLLLYPGNGESGGFHLVGASSTGKTTVLRAAASLFGSSVYWFSKNLTTHPYWKETL